MLRTGKTTVFQRASLRRAAVILLIIAVFLSMFLLFIQMSQESLIQSLTQLNNEFVEQVDTISGTLLEIIHNAAMQMFYSRSLAKLRTLDSVSNAERIAGMRDLGSWVSSSTFLSSALIYNAHTDTMYTSGGAHVPNAGQTYADHSTYDLMVSRARHGFTGPVKRESAEGEIYSFLFFEPNVPNSGALLLNVRAPWFENQLLGLSSGHNSVVLNSQGEVLAANEGLLSGAVQVWPELSTRLEDGEAHGIILDPRGNSGWMYAQLRNSGLIYLRSFDTSELLPGLARVRNFALGLLLAVSSVLVIGALYTVLVLYPPVRAVREALHKLGSSHGDMAVVMDRLVESRMEQQLADEVARLLQGEELGLLEYPASLILLNCSDPKSVRSALAKITPLPAIVAAAPIGCAALISRASEQQVLDLCLALSDVLSCRCLYGTPKESAAELSRCHASLQELWQMRFLYAGQAVLSEKLAASFSQPVELADKDVSALLSALRSGSLDEARAAWKEIFEQIRTAKFTDFRFFLRSILQDLGAMQSELGLDPFTETSQVLEGLEDAAQLHRLLDGVFQQIVDRQQERRRSSLELLAAKVDDRIAAGYGDVSLSAHGIADEMGMNPVYLSRLYKEATGVSIVDAIKKVRIDRAKQLLRATDASVKDIAEQVGFANDKYFFVVFKELCGTTPKEYRGSCQQ